MSTREARAALRDQRRKGSVKPQKTDRKRKASRVEESVPAADVEPAHSIDDEEANTEQLHVDLSDDAASSTAVGAAQSDEDAADADVEDHSEGGDDDDEATTTNKKKKSDSNELPVKGAFMTVHGQHGPLVHINIMGSCWHAGRKRIESF